MSPPACPKRAPATTMPCSSSSKRPRVAAPHGEWSWASLPWELVQLIAWRVLAGGLLDYVRFRATCSDWSSSTRMPRRRRPAPLDAAA
ncbi:hypothetical protein ABZP36_001941 [Zizania latifolia]